MLRSTPRLLFALSRLGGSPASARLCAALDAAPSPCSACAVSLAALAAAALDDAPSACARPRLARLLRSSASPCSLVSSFAMFFTGYHRCLRRSAARVQTLYYLRCRLCAVTVLARRERTPCFYLLATTAVCGAQCYTHMCSHFLRPRLCPVAVLDGWRRSGHRAPAVARCSIPRRPPYRRHGVAVVSHLITRVAIGLHSAPPRARVTQLPTATVPYSGR